MGWQWTPFTPFFVLGTVLLAVDGLYLFYRWHQRSSVRGLGIATVFVVCEAAVMAVYTVQWSLEDPQLSMYASRIGISLIGLLGPLVLAYVLVYTERYDLLTRRTSLVLFVPPVLTALSALTNGIHHEFWTDHEVIDTGTYQVTLAETVTHYGPLYWFFLTYTTLFVTVAVGLLVRAAVDADRHRRRQIGVLTAGILAPQICALIYLFGDIPEYYPPLAFFGFFITALVFTWPIFRHDLFTSVPIAHRTVVENMDDGVVAFDETGTVTSVNQAAASLLAQDRDELLQSTKETVLEPIREDVELAAAREQTQTLRRDGNIVEIEVTPIRKGGQQLGELVTLSDVTERQEREQELRRQNERLDQFASVVSHDLRNPLGVAKTYLEFAEETGDKSDFETVNEALDRMDAMIEGLLTMARTETVVENTEPLTLHALTTDAWQTAKTDGASLELDIDEGETVDGDPELLRHVFENLFRNAVDHNDPPITVRVGPLDGNPGGVYVEDDGAGIPKSERESVFEHGHTTRDDGTGLGLAIVRECVVAHGWEITATESAEGGARFEIRTHTQDE